MFNETPIICPTNIFSRSESESDSESSECEKDGNDWNYGMPRYCMPKEFCAIFLVYSLLGKDFLGIIYIY